MRAARVKEHVVRVHVAVTDLLRVQVLERGADGARDADHLGARVARAGRPPTKGADGRAAGVKATIV